MNRRKKIKGLKIDLYDPPPVMPDIMRSTKEGDLIRATNIDAEIKRLEERLNKLKNGDWDLPLEEIIMVPRMKDE